LFAPVHFQLFDFGVHAKLDSDLFVGELADCSRDLVEVIRKQPVLARTVGHGYDEMFVAKRLKLGRTKPRGETLAINQRFQFTQGFLPQVRSWLTHESRSREGETLFHPFSLVFQLEGARAE